MVPRTSRTVLALVAGVLIMVAGVAAPASAATLPPTAPTGLTATTDTAISWWIHLTWSDNTPASSPDNETRFEIERCLGAACTDFANIMNYATPGFDQTWFDDTGSKPDDTTYSYRIRGVNAAGASDWSGVAVSTTGWRAPAAPTGLTAAYVGADSRGLGGSTVLGWRDDATTEVGYAVRRCDPIDCAATLTDTRLPVDTASWTDASVVDGREYWYVAVALGGSGSDSASERLTHIAGSGLAAPTGATVARVGGGLKVSWRNQVRQPVRIWRCDTQICVDGATGAYRPEAPWLPKVTNRAGTTSWTDRFTPLPSTRYSYRIQVVTADAVSPPVFVSLTTR